MAREILFRGKRADNGEWVNGTPFFAYPTDSCKMIQAMAVHPDFVDEGNVYYSEGFPVDPKTVGQFTGRLDASERRIFEGDICRFFNDDGETTDYEVVWFPDGSRWGVRELGRSGIHIDDLDDSFCPRCEVAGTIFDDRT